MSRYRPPRTVYGPTTRSHALRRPSVATTLLLLLGTLAVHAPAHAQWIANGVPLTSTSGAPATPFAVSDSAGGTIVVWADNGDIRAQRISGLGVKQWGADGVVVCSASGTQASPRAVADGSGGAVIAWEDPRSGSLDIYAQRVNATGAVQWTANGVAICTATGTQANLAICSDGAGGAIVAWEDSRSSGPHIYAQRLDSGGSPQWTTDGLAICTAGSTQQNLTMVADGSGGAVIVWSDYRTLVYSVYGQRIMSWGSLGWNSSGVQLIYVALQQARKPALAAASDGNFLVACEGGGPVLGWNIYAKKLDSSGGASWASNAAVCSASGNQANPAIVSDGAGGGIVAWEDPRGSSLDIYSQRVGTSGAVSWTSDGVAVCSASGDQTLPALVEDGGGGAIITWQDGRSGLDVYAQRMNASGTAVWTSNGVALCSAAGSESAPVITTNRAGGAIIGWVDTSPPATIWAQRVNNLGATGCDYTITAGAGTNGSIVPSGSVGVNDGGSQHFSIAPSGGYRVATLTVDGSSVTPDTTYTFTDVTANHTISATFTIVTFTITAQVTSPGGRISPSGQVTVPYDGSQTFVFLPDSGYQVCWVAVDGSLLVPCNEYTFDHAHSDHSLLVEFCTTAPADTGSSGFVVNGTVTTLARGEKSLYLGGSFSSIGPATGGGAPLDMGTGALAGTFPKVAGSVYAAAPDGIGGWYLGGNFNAVGGQPRSYLAHMLADGSVSPWLPDLDYEVRVLLLRGQTLYVGGGFTYVNGAVRARLAAFDVSSGALTAWDPSPRWSSGDYEVTALASGPGCIYVGGVFNRIGGVARYNIAAIDSASGTATSWAPPIVVGPVYAIGAGHGTVYVGGDFSIYSTSGARFNLAAFDSTSGSLTAWCPEPDQPVHAIVVAEQAVYVGGEFGVIDYATLPHRRFGIAALDPVTGSPTSWSPVDSTGGSQQVRYPPACKAMVLSGTTLYVGGSIENLYTFPAHQYPRSNLAAFDTRYSNYVSPWSPGVNDVVETLVASGATLYAGGDFTSADTWSGALSLTALDLTTGGPTGWGGWGLRFICGLSPDYRAIAHGLLVKGDSVYVAGKFTEINGLNRNGLAVLDAGSGAVLGWDPFALFSACDSTMECTALAADASNIYVGAETSGRCWIEALTRTGDAAVLWRLPTNAMVHALAVHDGTLYIGGEFDSLGGRPRRYLAAANAATGAVADWNPGGHGTWPGVYALAPVGGVLYAGGRFDSLGGQPRSCIAALDAGSGAALPWSPNANEIVDALVVDGTTVYAGGGFTNIGGRTVYGMAAVDVTTGLARAWDLHLDSGVDAIALGDGRLHIGGGFRSVEYQPRGGLATVVALNTVAVPPNPLGRFLTLSQSYPNPAQHQANIRLTLPRAGLVTLRLFDVQGRCVLTPLAGAYRPAGVHNVEIQVTSLHPGIYFYRLDFGRERRTGRMVVAR